MSARPFPGKGLLLAGALVLLAGCRSGAPRERVLLRCWESHPRSPLEYIVGKFSTHDWVFLGEYHRVKHDVDLVAALIPALHEKTDVRLLAWEFLTREATDRANDLVTAETYDRGATIALFRDQFPSWSYEEYLGIFKAAWESNRRFSAEKGPFLFAGLHPGIRWEKVHDGTPEEARRELAKQERYDEIMARRLEEEALSPGRKALVYTGIAHATGRFKEYYVGQGGRQLLRMGNLVAREPYKERMFFVALHAPFYDSGTRADIYPFDGTLDRLMKKYGRDIGFDVAGTPFSGLTHKTRTEFSITAHEFGELYDGYVMFKTPLKEYRGMTCVPDWILTEADFTHYWRNLPDRDSGLEISRIPFEEFKRSFCEDNPDYGEGFSKRFRRLPDID